MRVFEWKLDDSYKYLYVCSKEDADRILNKNFEAVNLNSFTYDNDYYFLANDATRIISPLPSLDYAFGSGNKELPYGKELSDQKLMDSFAVLPFEKVQLYTQKKLIGAIAGDVAGSRYEYVNARNRLHPADLIDDVSTMTDETVLMAAVAKGLSNALKKTGHDWMDDPKKRRQIESSVKKSLKFYSEVYKNVGYEHHLYRWLVSENPKKITADTADAAVRGIYAGYIAASLKEAEELGALQASVTHSNPEVIRAAAFAAGIVYIGSHSKSIDDMKKYAEFYYGPIGTLEGFHASSDFDSSSHAIMTRAAAALFEGQTFAEVLCNAIYAGGDSDTIAFMAGAAAETIYPVPKYLRKKASRRIPAFLAKSLYRSIDETNQN